MKTTFTYLPLLALIAVLAGCKPGTDRAASGTGAGDISSDAPVVMDEMPPMMDGEHGHPEHGPHGGDLVELGKEAFHAELVHGDGGISMYVLDSAATKQVPIGAEKLVVSLKHDGQVASFDLTANPDASDPPGQTSRFTSTDPKLDEMLDAGAEGAVVIQIEGKSYTGKVAHDHEGHDHAGHRH